MSSPTEVPIAEQSIEARMEAAFGLDSTPELESEAPAQEPRETDPETVESDPADSELTEEPEEDFRGAPPDAEGEISEEEVGPEDEISNTAQLAEAFGVDEAVLYENLKVKVGEEELPLSVVLERAGQNPLPEQITQEVGRHRQAMEQYAAQYAAQAQQTEAAHLAMMNNMIETARATAGFSDMELQKLHAEDPELWAVKREERRQFEESLAQQIQAANHFQQQRKAQQQQAYQARVAHEGMLLIQAIPEWRDQNLAIKEATEIGQFMQERYGFTPQEMSDMPDHRLAAAFRRLHQLEMGATKQAQIKSTLSSKKLNAPKTVVPTSSRKPRTDKAANHFAALRKLQRETAGDARRRDDHDNATAGILSKFLE